ncbi:unnamed protein product [Amoebophrya sp. A25]|nr:unnamed protein product [Amoebophrya sp. A25]|eukprot:GSA25T00000121001.1
MVKMITHCADSPPRMRMTTPRMKTSESGTSSRQRRHRYSDPNKRLLLGRGAATRTWRFWSRPLGRNIGGAALNAFRRPILLGIIGAAMNVMAVLRLHPDGQDHEFYTAAQICEKSSKFEERTVDGPSLTASEQALALASPYSTGGLQRDTQATGLSNSRQHAAASPLANPTRAAGGSGATSAELKLATVERELEILRPLFEKRSRKNTTHTFQVFEELWAGPKTECWEDPRFNFKRCCNAMHFSVTMNTCWDGNKFTQDSCCGSFLYYPSSCLDFVRHFEFAMIQSMSSDLVTETLGNCLEFLRGEDLRGYVKPGFEPFDVAGWHYPTITIQHAGLKKFSFPALDAYVGNSFLVDGHWMPVEVELLRAFLPEGSVVVDAGANIGGFTLPLAKRVGRAGMVYAFEPFRVIFQHLTANVALNGLLNVITFQHGLGAKRESVSLPMPNMNKLSNPAKSSVAETDNLMMIETEKDYEEEVEIKPLDDYFRKFLKKVFLIKIDVEKMEVPMLEGARGILQYHRPLVFVEDSEESREGPPLENLDQRPHLQELIAKMQSRFRPETDSSSKVTRLLWYYGYLCIDLYKEVGGQLTSLFCAPDEKLEAMWEGVKAFFDRTEYRGSKR